MTENKFDVDPQSYQLGFDSSLKITQVMLTSLVAKEGTIQQALDVINAVIEASKLIDEAVEDGGDIDEILGDLNIVEQGIKNAGVKL